MSEIEITDALLDEIEAKAKAATQGRWERHSGIGVYSVGEDGRHKNLADVIGGKRLSDKIANGDHIARVDPPTALALVATHRAALARIAELEAGSVSTADYEAVIELTNQAREIAVREARRKALEEAASLIEGGFDRGIARKVDQCSHGKFEWEDCEKCASAAIRALKDKEPGR